jgi:hypothetical protein
MQRRRNSATGEHSLEAFRALEPFAVKVARTVLRRGRRGNPPDLSDPTLDKGSYL